MDRFTGAEPISIDLVYANADHPRNIFECAIYKSEARCWAHRDVAAITLLAARFYKDETGNSIQIKDCLRTVDAQERMQETDIVKANPQWMEAPRLLAPPGGGGHPRAMAIDVCALYADGSQVDMGTPFDWMERSSARDYTDFHENILENRRALEHAFVRSAQMINPAFAPYPAEWWDYRFPPDYYNAFAPLSDSDLPPQMQMCETQQTAHKNFPEDHFITLATDILAKVDKAYENHHQS
jgi:D-alanyl-D-alanine dipeptidase